ncbi:MAG TPA: HAMP domain-containing protein [Tepidiformaceae bacterium]|nr:HAMP domain-containing protein [Tepidiformaceae bacterium]HMO95831.1 HAMP domain-containing protein [Tepidiformaceae bacterium]
MRRVPGLSHLADLRIATKLALVVIALSIPIVALLAVQFEQRQDAQSQASAESDGIDYVSAIVPFLREVQLHRGFVHRVLNGDTESVEQLEASAAAADSALAAINQMNDRYGAKFGTEEYVAFINREWSNLRGGTASFEVLSTAHGRIINEGVFPLLNQVATESGMVLDPSLDTRSVITALTVSLPRMTEALSLTRNWGTAAMLSRSGDEVSPAQRTILTQQLAIARVHAEALNAELATAMAENPAFARSLKPIVDGANESREGFLRRTEFGVLASTNLSAAGAEEYFLQGGSAIDLSNQLLAASRDTLKAEFDSRASAAQSEFMFYGSAALIGVVLALALALFIAMTITRPLNHLAEVADRMSLGDLDVDIDVESRNEIGQLAESLRRMQASLRSAIERLRQRRAAA